MPKVSIIIPIYNVEKYIERCARSLFEQTEEDLEFIFVNDCTPDNSMQILNGVIKDYPSRKDQIKIFANEKNMGLPLTRQRGLKETTGEYIIHCDSDDWVDINMYRMLYEKAKADDLDIVWCDFYKSDGINNDYIIQNTKIDKIDIFKDILNSKKMAAMWNHLVKRSIIYDYSYVIPISNFLEDMVLIVQYMYYSNKIGYVNAPLYYYYNNIDSITSYGSKEKEINQLIDHETNLKVVFSFLKQKKLDALLKEEIFHRKFVIKNWSLFMVKKVNDCNIWVRRFKEINIPVFFNQKVALRDKINFLLVELRLYPLKNWILRRHKLYLYQPLCQKYLLSFPFTKWRSTSKDVPKASSSRQKKT
jgi:glycosyltransferase involved in cell wall biosynthesis